VVAGGVGGGGPVEAYLTLGLRLGRHIDGMVDAYYGPQELAAAVAAEPVVPPEQLVVESRSLLAALGSGEPLDGPASEDSSAPARRHSS